MSTLWCALQVITALTASCVFLLIRTCFGFLSVEHIQFSQQSHLLYGCLVLPELIALYIVAIPGLISGVGVDLADTAGVVPLGTSSSHIPMASGSPPYGFSGRNGVGGDEDQGIVPALLPGRGDTVTGVVLPLDTNANGSLVDNYGSAAHSHANHGYVSYHGEVAQEDMQHAHWHSMPGANQVQP